MTATAILMKEIKTMPEATAVEVLDLMRANERSLAFWNNEEDRVWDNV